MKIKIFKKYPNLYFEMSKKKDGSMKIEKNRNFFLKKIGISLIVKAELCHKNKIAKVGVKNIGKTIKNTDGLITKEKSVFLSITVADCLPIAFYNPKEKEIGLIHAGWKGINFGIIENLKIDFEKTLFYIGPGISKCHFEVKKDFPLPYFKKEKKYFSDLKKIVKDKIILLGGKEKNIEINLDCTYCKKNKYFSFRREKKINPMIVIFGMKEKKYQK